MLWSSLAEDKRSASRWVARRRRGLIINIVGPDGSGKTTLVNALVTQLLAGRSVKVIAQRGGADRRPGALPHRRVRGPTTEPHRHPPYSRAVSAAKACYLFTDFALGWVIHLRPFVRRGGWLVVERGWWDIAVDPLRYRLRPPARLVRVLGCLLPRANVMVVLEAPPDVIRTRKTQVSEAELLRQISAWRTLRVRGSPPVVLNAALPVEQLLADVSALIERCRAGHRPALRTDRKEELESRLPGDWRCTASGPATQGPDA